MWLAAPPLLSSPPLFPPVPANIWRCHRRRRGGSSCCANVMWCCLMWWCTCNSAHSEYIFFYLSYFSLPLTHHMTLVEINTFSHQCASLLMPPPTPMANSHHHHYFQHQRQGWRQGVGDVDGWTGGLEMCLHLKPQVSSYFSFFFFALLTIFFTIRLHVHELYQWQWTSPNTWTNRRARDPQVSSFFSFFIFALLTSFFLFYN